MEFFYEGKDISNDVSIRTAELTDTSGERLDSVTLEINNPINEWSKWHPNKYDTMYVKEGAFSSGKMIVDTIKQRDGYIILKGLPIKKISKEKHTKSWEDVTLMELLSEFSSKYGLSLKTYGVQNFTYKRVNQINVPDFVFLNERCAIEGYVLKISDGALIIFDEKVMESSTGIIIDSNQIVGNFKYSENEVYGSVKVKYGSIEGIYKAIEGPELVVDHIEVNSIGEAQRFAKNILRNTNKYENTISFDTKLNTHVAAGSTITVNGLGMGDSKYYVYTAIYQFEKDITRFCVRQIPSW